MASAAQVSPPTGPERIVAGFARALRGAGVAVPTGSVILFADALGAVGLADPDRVYWAGRATLVRSREDVDAYDSVFASYWASRPRAAPQPEAVYSVALAVDDAEDGLDGDVSGDPVDSVLAVRYSAVEVLEDRDLAGLDADEWAEAQRLLSCLRVSAELRPSRRTRRSARHSGRHPDLRATVRRSLPSGGVPLRRSWRETVERPRRMVFLLDVSGSMDPYARALLRFVHAAAMSRRSGGVEAFTLGTRLTRITRELGRRDPEAALASVAAAVADWSGGTRIGWALGAFNDGWGLRGMARGAVVVVLSDGWDRGDPDVVAEQMQRLSRVAHKVVWVNPLKSSPGYAPLARGMAAALPYVDLFVEGHSVSSLEQLGRIVAGVAGRGPEHMEVRS